MHDFRRTISTRMNNDLAIAPHVVEAILGHAVKGVAGIYNRADYLNEQRRALERWAEYLDRLTHGQGRNGDKAACVKKRIGRALDRPTDPD